MTSHQGDLTGLKWRKSSYSNSGNCIEAAEAFTEVVAVRDSKDPDGPALLLGARAWSAFIESLTR